VNEPIELIELERRQTVGLARMDAAYQACRDLVVKKNAKEVRELLSAQRDRQNQ
jgi:hypothetical protein